MSNLADRMADEAKSAKMYDIFTKEERKQYIQLIDEGKEDEADELMQMAEKRNILH